MIFPKITGQLELVKDGIIIDGDKFTFTFVFCSDWKFLALVLGIKAANSKYFCPWCLIDKDRIHYIDEDWNALPRLWHKTSACFDCKAMKEKKPCYRSNHEFVIENNLLRTIFSPDNCVIDVLHLILRTSDILEAFLYENAARYAVEIKLEKMARDNCKFFFILK